MLRSSLPLGRSLLPSSGSLRTIRRGFGDVKTGSVLQLKLVRDEGIAVGKYGLRVFLNLNKVLLDGVLTKKKTLVFVE
jgi:hypothetical protein